MIGAPNTWGQNCLLGIVQWAPGTLVSEEIADIFHNHNSDWQSRNLLASFTTKTVDSFTCPQVGNCKSFTLTHYLADLFATHRGPRSIPLCIQHHIQLTSLSFQVSRPSQSWDTAISKFDLENPRSRSWVRSKFEVTMWVQHSIDSNPFRSMSIGHPIPDTIFFKIWPWKSKVNVMGEVNVESHNMGPTFYQLTSLSFHVNWPIPFLRYDFFKIWPWKSRSRSWLRSKVKVTKWV